MTADGTSTRRSLGAPIMGWIALPLLFLVGNDGGMTSWTLAGMATLAPAGVLWLHLRTSKMVRVVRARTASFHEGQAGKIQVEVANDNHHDVLDGEVHCLGAARGKEGPSRQTTIKASTTSWVAIPIPAGLLKRGEHHAGMISVKLGYPFNLFFTKHQAWDNTPVIVYPAVEQGAPDWPAHHHLEKRKSREGEDVVGHRDYRVGDPMRAVDWKLSARAGGLVVREFERTIPRDLVFSLEQVADLEFEAGLRRLTAWILRADKQGRRYGMDLGGYTIPSGSGQQQKIRCLTALARLPGRAGT